MITQLPAPPAWLKDCAPSSYLNARDVTALLRVSRATFYNLIKTGMWPVSDHSARSINGLKRSLWSVGLVLRTLNEAQSGGA